MVADFTLPDGRLLYHELVARVWLGGIDGTLDSMLSYTGWRLKPKRESVDFGPIRIQCHRGNGRQRGTFG